MNGNPPASGAVGPGGFSLQEAAREPGRDCPLCPRLVAFRERARQAEPAWHNAPVPSFGTRAARLLVVGLAPGLRGANRTGRPFTGDYAGDLLYETLGTYGFARGDFRARPDDGLELVDCLITNAVRCVPPENKPVGQEIASCRPFLSATIEGLPRLSAIVALGRIAHESTLRALGVPLSKYPFGHAARHDVKGIALFDSYHCSRYNTNTGRLTPEMFQAVFAAVRAHIGRGG
jgi:uracil-DNA glycosylase family 4